MWSIQEVFLLLGTLCTASFGTYVWTVWYRPTSVTQYISDQGLRIAHTSWMIVSGIGLGVIIMSSLNVLLGWMPSTWGSRTEDGDWVALRNTIATGAALFGGFGGMAMLGELAEFRASRARNLYVFQALSELSTATTEQRNCLKRRWEESLRDSGKKLEPHWMAEANRFLLGQQEQWERTRESQHNSRQVVAEPVPKDGELKVHAIKIAPEAARKVDVPSVNLDRDLSTLPAGSVVAIGDDDLNLNIHRIGQLIASSVNFVRTKGGLHGKAYPLLPKGMTLPGATNPHDFAIQYEGDSHGGVAKLLVGAEGNAWKPAIEGVRFALTPKGLASAFFLAWQSRGYCSFWHGAHGAPDDYFDRAESLRAYLFNEESFKPDDAEIQAVLKRSLGLQVTRHEHYWRVSCIGCWSNIGVCDFWVFVDPQGAVSDQGHDVLVKTNLRTLY